MAAVAIPTPTSSFDAYYAQPLWTAYDSARLAWIKAVSAYVMAARGTPEQEKARLAMLDASDRKHRLFDQLCATPEHRAAFGW